MTNATDMLREMTGKAAAIPGVAYRTHNADGHASRAEAAAALVEAGKVQFVGFQAGNDRDDHWLVNGHRCSIGRKACDCYDNSAPTHNGGRLCKHRIAAMMQRRIMEMQARALDAIFADAKKNGAEEISIRMDVYFKARGRDFLITHYRNGGPPVRFEARADRIAITDKEFDALIERHGWELADRPFKSGWLGMEYTLRPIEHGKAKPEFTLNATTSDTMERRRFAEVYAAAQAAEWAEMDATDAANA